MNRIGFLALLAGVWMMLFTPAMQAQEDGGRPARRSPQMGRSSERNRQNDSDGDLPELTVRAQHLNDQLTQEVGNARWMRIIYRELNMLEDKNAPLYYPVTPINGTQNLFTTIFRLVADGKLPAYEYLDGYEAFDDAHLVDFKSVLDRFSIMFQTSSGRDGRTRYVINDSDVPSGEVRAFYVKEAWYFDQNNSVFDVKTLALSPIIFYEGDMGTERTPMFWVLYEEVRPYVSNTYIMTSNMNNAKTFTIDDYFRRRMFDGKIIKTENLLNIPLQAYCPTPDSMAHEQQKIEDQLQAFNKNLWFQPDTTAQVAATSKTKKSARRGSSAKKSDSSDKESTAKPKAEKAAKAPKAPKVKAEKSAGATRSVRRRR